MLVRIAYIVWALQAQLGACEPFPGVAMAPERYGGAHDRGEPRRAPTSDSLAQCGPQDMVCRCAQLIEAINCPQDYHINTSPHAKRFIAIECAQLDSGERSDNRALNSIARLQQADEESYLLAPNCSSVGITARGNSRTLSALAALSIILTFCFLSSF